MKAFAEKLRSVLGYSFNWLFNPITNSRRDALSLGRLLLFGYTGSLIYTILFHRQELFSLNGYAMTLLIVIFLVLTAYCFGDKPWVRETILTLAGRVAPATYAGQARTLMASVAGPADGEAAQIAERTEYPPEEKPPEPRKESTSGPLI